MSILNKEKKTVTIYTDGSCLGNPGPGGYAAILICDELRKEISGGEANTTNNRMELIAVIKAFEALKSKNYKIKLISDSKYVLNAFEGNKLTLWRNSGYHKVKNPDLLEQLFNAIQGFDISTRWTKGHANNQENNRCDFLAKKAAEQFLQHKSASLSR